MKRHSQQGIALVITLIMLSVITFMAVTFLALSTRERGSVTTANDQLAARLAADAALDRAKIQLVGTMLANTNSQLFDLLVSRNYITPAGFDTATAIFPNPTNVNYDYTTSGGKLNTAEFEENLENLLYDPRPPVFISTNINAGFPLDFRFYLDLNQNGEFDTNGEQPVIVNNAQETVNGVVVSNNFTGDPEWIGILANPLAPHSPTNRFVSRIAYFVAPAGKTLDINYIHNEASDPNQTVLNTAGSDYLRDQGVGTWEINLAAFLCDLNTNEWDLPPANSYQYEPLNAVPTVSGIAFQDAESIYSYRLNGNYNSLNSALGTFGPFALNNVPNGTFYDAYEQNPLMTAVAYTNYSQALVVGKPWAGANNTNQSASQFFSPGDLFNSTKVGTGFAGRLAAAGAASDSYDRYTFYRLAAQLGTDTGPERGKLNVNFVNFTNIGSQYAEIPNFETNQYRWGSPNTIPSTATNTFNLNLFNDAADMLIRMYTTNWLAEDPTNYIQTFSMNVPFSITNIPVWMSNRFVYTPSVHRLLQLAANICEVTGTNRVFVTGGNGLPLLATNFPNVFRPIFSKMTNQFGTNVYITGYINIENATSFLQYNTGTGAYTYVPVFHDLYNNDPAYPLSISLMPLGPMYSLGAPPLGPLVPGTPDMVDGVPLVIGARKGFPNFNELSYTHGVTAIRKLEFQRGSFTEPADAPGNPVAYTNQLYTFILTNVMAMEAWNSYSNAYPGHLQLIASNNYAVYLYTNYVINIAGVPVTNPITLWSTNSDAIYSQNIAAWPGFTVQGASAPSSLQRPSFIVPFTNSFSFTTNLEFNQSPPTSQGFNSAYEAGLFYPIQVGPGVFPIYAWWVGHTNRFRYALVDTDANRIVDYVSLVNQDQPIDIAGDLQSDAQNPPQGNTDPTLGGQWLTNIFSNPQLTEGINDQIWVGLNRLLGFPPGFWNGALNPGLTEKQDDINNFVLNLTGVDQTGQGLQPNEYIFNAPYVPLQTIAEQIDYEANDPFVHYNAADLGLTNSITLYPPYPLGVPMPFLPRNIGLQVNGRYQPWGIGSQIPYNVQYKDPMITRSDDWSFPTNVLPNVGWLGRIHRGSPWQTVYMKSWDVDTNQADNLNSPSWRYWTGNPNVVDALRTRPVEDWKIFDLFTTALNDNSTEGQLSVNQSGLAAWSAILSGVIPLTNNVSDANVSGDIAPTSAPWVIEPAGYAGTNSPLGLIVTGINTTRAGTNFGGTFQHVGDVLATPELTIGTNQSGILTGSPYLNLSTNQQQSGINDAMYERIPQQIMSLLRLGQTRFVIYSYGQTLRPAPNSIVTSSGQFFGLCTNYQITAEVATRAVVRVDNAPTSLNTNATPHIVIESFNVLPSD